MTAYRSVSMERPELFLPDGRRADALDRTTLWRELESLSIPGVTPHMGVLDLLNTYEAALVARREAKLRTEQANV